MKLKSLILSLFTIFFLIGLSGCGNETSSQSCQIEVEMGLDTASSSSEYQDVIDLIDGDCSSAFSDDEAAQYKIAAYYGKAGLNITSLGSDLLAEDANMTEILSNSIGNETFSDAMEAVENLVEATILANANCSDDTAIFTSLETKYCNYRELTYTLDAFSLLMQTGLDINQVSDSDYLFSFLSDVDVNVLIEDSSSKLNTIISSANCSDSDSLSMFQSVACTTSDLITMASSASVTALAVGEMVSYNGTTVSAFTALTSPSSVGIQSGNSTQFDINASGVFDDTEITGFVLGYASSNSTANYTTVSGNGSLASGTMIIYEGSANVTFTSASANYTYFPIQVAMDDQSSGDIYTQDNTYYTYVDTTNHKKLVYKLVDQTLGSPAVTSGTCEIDFTACTANSTVTNVDNLTCYPCPVVKSDGTAMDASSSIADALNDDSNADNEVITSVKEQIYCSDYDSSNATDPKTDYCADNATLAIPDITSTEIANFLSSVQ